MSYSAKLSKKTTVLISYLLFLVGKISCSAELGMKEFISLTSGFQYITVYG